MQAKLRDVISVAAGSAHTVALKSDGTVVAWGDNDYAQTEVPPGLSGVIAISARGDHTLALKKDGTVAAWGDNHNGQNDTPANLGAVIAVQASGSFSVALRSDGTVAAWGWYNQTYIPVGLSNVVAIASFGHTMALKSDGTVVAWGRNDYGQTDVPLGLDGVVAIAAGGNHSVALRSNGTVVAWGWNHYGQADVPAGLEGVIAIVAGGNHTVALKSDGSVNSWGRNDDRQASVPEGLARVIAIAAGREHTVAVVTKTSAINEIPAKSSSKPGGIDGQKDEDQIHTSIAPVLPSSDLPIEIAALCEKAAGGIPTTFMCYGSDKLLFMARLRPYTAYAATRNGKLVVVGFCDAEKDFVICCCGSKSEHDLLSKAGRVGGLLDQLDRKLLTESDRQSLRPVSAYSNFALPGCDLVSMSGFNLCISNLRSGRYSVVPIMEKGVE